MSDTTRLQRLGNSTGLALRKRLLADAGFRRGDEVRLLAAPGEIRILAADSLFARSLTLGEALAVRHARVLRALLRGSTAVAPAATRGGAQQPWIGQAPAAGQASPSADGTSPAAALPYRLPPPEALLQLQRGALARLADAAKPADLAKPAVATTAAGGSGDAAVVAAIRAAIRAAIAAALAAAAGSDGASAEPPTLAAVAAHSVAELLKRCPSGAATAPALAFLAGNLVLELNGHYLDVTEGAAVAAMAALADPSGNGETARDAFAGWIADNAYPLHRWYA